METGRRAGIEPGDAAPHGRDAQFVTPQLFQVHVGDFQLAAGARLQALAHVVDLLVIPLTPRRRVGRLGFFFDADRFDLAVKLDNTLTLWVGDAVGEDVGAAAELGVGVDDIVAPVENIIAQDQADRLTVDEVLGDEESLSDAAGRRLLPVAELHPPSLAIAQERL